MVIRNAETYAYWGEGEGGQQQLTVASIGIFVHVQGGVQFCAVASKRPW